MIGRQVIVFGNVLRPKTAVRRWVVEFERVDHATLHCGHNFAARQLCHRHAHFLHQISGKTHGAVFEPLQIGHSVHFAFEPAKGLCEHWETHVTHNVHAQNILLQFAIKLCAAACIEPRQHRGGRAAKDRARAEQGRRFVFAIPIDRHRMGRVQNTVIDRVQHLERPNNGACGQQIDL